MIEEILITKVEFTPKVCTYWLLSGAIVLTITVVGIPLLLLWLPIGFVLTKLYLDKMECVLTNKVLKVNKGLLVRTEKTIPLEKITDLGLVQGPIMRLFGIEQLTVETAGQSGAGPLGALVSLTGIIDAKAFRQEVLNQRDKQNEATLDPVPKQNEEANNIKLLSEIKDSLARIEKLMADKK